MHECPYCGAVFWFQECVKSASAIVRHKIVYNLCCKGGKIDLKTYKKPPEPLCTLLRFDGDERSKQFLRQIRSYNALFAFTSLGEAVDRTFNNGTLPYVFKINGVVHHRIGTLLPQQGARAKFAQFYMHDTENEIHNRLSLFENDDNNPIQSDVVITHSLINMLNKNNQLVKAF
jgi:hypothetical protein